MVGEILKESASPRLKMLITNLGLNDKILVSSKHVSSFTSREMLILADSSPYNFDSVTAPPSLALPHHRSYHQPHIQYHVDLCMEIFIILKTDLKDVQFLKISKVQSMFL